MAFREIRAGFFGITLTVFTENFIVDLERIHRIAVLKTALHFCGKIVAGEIGYGVFQSGGEEKEKSENRIYG